MQILEEYTSFLTQTKDKLSIKQQQKDKDKKETNMNTQRQKTKRQAGMADGKTDKPKSQKRGEGRE